MFRKKLDNLLTGSDVNWDSHPRHDRNIKRKTKRKYELFRSYVEGSRVLDVGSAGGSAGFVTDDYWLHGWLSDHTDFVVGLDVDKDGVSEAREAGYDVRLASAESFDFDERFDTVVAANVVEHLASPGAMLECARDHLVPDGRLLITTPRTHLPWNLLQQLKNERGIQPHPEHTMWFCRATLTELLERTGFEVLHYRSWGFDRQGMTAADSVWRAFERLLSTIPPLDEIDDYQHFVVATPTDR
jgi:2-polyprenyl-3-methyl-5-hydroxy-6-metoxy-1,4-benzoquinol methylase